MSEPQNNKKRRARNSKAPEKAPDDNWHVSCPKKEWKCIDWDPSDLTVARRHHLSHRPLSGKRSYEVRVYSLTARYDTFFGPDIMKDKELWRWWKTSPFGSFSKCVATMSEFPGSRQFIFALLEYWWDTTNTFHFPWGEMTITPKDFAMLTGLEFTSLAVDVDDKLKFGSEGVRDLLGPVVGTLKANKSYAKPEELYDGIFMEGTTLEQKIRLLALIFISGYMVCDSGTSQRCYLYYLESLRDLSQVKTFSWASLAYTHLLNGMRYACRVDNDATTATCPGPFRIIEFWAYEYFKLMAPKRVLERGCPAIWSWRKSEPLPAQDMFQRTRNGILMMEAKLVNWRPWTGLSGPIPNKDLDEVTEHSWVFSGGGEVAWYLSERVVRQHSSNHPRVPKDPPSDMLAYEKLKKSFLDDSEPPPEYGVHWSMLVHDDVCYDTFIKTRLASPVVLQLKPPCSNFAEGEIPYVDLIVRYPGPSGEMEEVIPEPPAEALLSSRSIPEDFEGFTREGSIRVLRVLDGYRWRLQCLLSERANANQPRAPPMPYFPSFQPPFTGASSSEGTHSSSSMEASSSSGTTSAPPQLSMPGQFFFASSQSQPVFWAAWGFTNSGGAGSSGTA